jgi:hypothetical protein
MPFITPGHFTAIAVALAIVAGPLGRSSPPLPSAAAEVEAGSNAAVLTMAERAERRQVERGLGLGDAAGFATWTSTRFILISDAPRDEATATLDLMERTGDAVEALARDLALPTRPLQRRLLSVAFVESERFERFARDVDWVDARWMSGYWMPGPDRTVFRGGRPAVGPSSGQSGVFASADAGAAATVVHEAAHQLLHRLGIQRRAPRAPLFLAEGLAVSFEPLATGGRAFDADARRDACVARGLAQERLLPLKRLVALARLPGQGDEAVDLFYAQSASLVRHLRLTRPTAFARYLVTLKERAGTLSPMANRTIFEQCFGPIDEIEAVWRGSLERR